MVTKKSPSVIATVSKDKWPRKMTFDHEVHKNQWHLMDIWCQTWQVTC